MNREIAKRAGELDSSLSDLEQDCETLKQDLNISIRNAKNFHLHLTKYNDEIKALLLEFACEKIKELKKELNDLLY